MILKDFIKIECLKKNITITSLTLKLGLSQRSSLYYHINKKTPEVLSKIEEILSLEKGALLNNI